MHWIKHCLKNYLKFTGRACKQEWATFAFFMALVLLVALGLDRLMGWGTKNVVDWMTWHPTFEIARMLLVLPGLAVTARRLHDVGQSGFLAGLWFIPIIGWLFLLRLMVKDGDSKVDDSGVS